MCIDIFLKITVRQDIKYLKKQGYQNKFYQKPTIEIQKLTV